MTAILNAFPYPWGLADAVRLHKDLTVAFPVVEDAKNLAAAAGLNPYAGVDEAEAAEWSVPRLPPSDRGLAAAAIERASGQPVTKWQGALWSVLAAVCCLPDARQALRYAVLVTQAAFAPSAVRFTEFARLATVAGSGDTNAVETARSVARQRAAAIAGLRELGDQWGHHLRRLVAHAEVAAVVLGDRAAAQALLDAARALPLGYAGYRAPAYLAMAETSAILGDPQGRHDALEQALRSAHNIQEPAFCYRDDHDHISIDLVRDARTPQDLASALGIVPARLLELNPRADTATMVLPDPEFAPIVAAWLSARIAEADLARLDRLRLTAALVPIATADPTALDLVLGRWVCALGPGFEGLPALLGPLTRRSTVEPAGGGQAGVS